MSLECRFYSDCNEIAFPGPLRSGNEAKSVCVHCTLLTQLYNFPSSLRHFDCLSDSDDHRSHVDSRKLILDFLYFHSALRCGFSLGKMASADVATTAVVAAPSGEVHKLENTWVLFLDKGNSGKAKKPKKQDEKEYESQIVEICTVDTVRKCHAV